MWAPFQVWPVQTAWVRCDLKRTQRLTCHRDRQCPRSEVSHIQLAVEKQIIIVDSQRWFFIIFRQKSRQNHVFSLFWKKGISAISADSTPQEMAKPAHQYSELDNKISLIFHNFLQISIDFDIILMFFVIFFSGRLGQTRIHLSRQHGTILVGVKKVVTLKKKLEFCIKNQNFAPFGSKIFIFGAKFKHFLHP